MSSSFDKESGASSDRRRWMMAGAVGLVAAAAGAGIAWQRFEPHAQEPDNFWSLSFPPPDGGAPLALSAFRGRPLLVNFWATWCPPCVEELPLLNRFYGENKGKGWQLLGLAVDKAESVKRFMARLPLDFPIAMAGMEGTDLARALGNSSGGLPYTVLFGPNGRVAERKIGQLREADLQAWRNRF